MPIRDKTNQLKLFKKKPDRTLLSTSSISAMASPPSCPIWWGPSALLPPVSLVISSYLRFYNSSSSWMMPFAYSESVFKLAFFFSCLFKIFLNISDLIHFIIFFSLPLSTLSHVQMTQWLPLSMEPSRWYVLRCLCRFVREIQTDHQFIFTSDLSLLLYTWFSFRHYSRKSWLIFPPMLPRLSSSTLVKISTTRSSA